MNYLKRTWISLKRRPLQSVLMFLIVFVLGNFLFASIAVKQTSDNVRLEMRSRMPSHLTVILTNDNQSEKVQPKMKRFLEEIKENENILSINVIETATFSLPMKSSEYDPYPNESGYYMDMQQFVALNDVDNSIYDYEIISGRFYTQEELDEGAYKIVLPEGKKYVYDYNENGMFEIVKTYEVGDKISFSLYDYIVRKNNITELMSFNEVVPNFDSLPEVEFEIIGIANERLKDKYQNEDFNIYGIEIPKKCIENMVKIHNEAIDKHDGNERKKYFYNYGHYLTSNSEIAVVEIVAKGIDASENLQNDILANNNYQRSYYKMISSVEDYRYIQAPLDNLVALANVAQGASIFLVVSLLSLVSILFMRKRTKEIGILMSLGEKKHKILIQFVLEILLVGLIAASVSMVSGSYFGEIVSKEFMEIQIDADYELQYQEKNPETITQLDLLDVYEIEIDVAYIVTIYAVATVVLLISSVAPIVYILRTDPKKILV